MNGATDLGPVLVFLAQLKENNNRAWFEEHRAQYELARQRFEALVARLIAEFSSFEQLDGIEPKDCMMRIYRDIRFSKDKSPYRTNLGASIGPGGRKSSSLTYYFRIAPHGETMLAGGLHEPTPDELYRFRKAIDEDAAAFRTVVGAPDFVHFYGAVGGDRLKTVPQGFDRDHPELYLLRLKQVLAMRNWQDEDVLAPNFTSDVSAAAKALKPFLDYLTATVR